ncbi:serine--tRNA ligase, mitochondrial isoform X4 [Bacillus rossius redtenbacheri]|uniref:serine--tRNA ligase, mitochondrial isoform X4 n=1 Tax=Bacillus rossius redtenbacheri TaxID=93214 RepID=UPI002FDE4A18
MIGVGRINQVYRLDELHGSDLCLSGTAEMALAGYVMNRQFHASELPLRLAAVSRCFRAETSRLSEERGIYRVHQFTKVEMFAVTDKVSSDSLLEEFREIQEEIFAGLGLHLQTLDMPPHELGAPAYRKYDLEAWLPGRNMFGEVSSGSNCTDYQSRRLAIKYWPRGASVPEHAHTVNGTACAIPRMLIALVETHQERDGTVVIPELLRPFMLGRERLVREERIPHMKLMKPKHFS